MTAQNTTRRQFIARSVIAAATVAIVPRHVLGGPGETPPSEVITRATIGCGGQGMGGHVVANEAGKTAVQLAVCDVDQNHLKGALKKAGAGCQGYTDFRYILDRKDIDTVRIATPPHWHALISIAAAQAGKDVVCEKPMTKFIAEGRAVVNAIKRYGRVYQIGTYGRFSEGQAKDKKYLKKLIASGVLKDHGGPTLVPHSGGFKVKEWSGKTSYTPQPIPPQLNYDMWLGPAPYKPYHPHRVHGSFRGYWDYDGGGLADMAHHFLDGVQYYLHKDDTGPTEIEAIAPWPAHPDACGLWGRVTLKYADGTTLIFESREWGEPRSEPPMWPQGEPKLSEQQKAQVAAMPDFEPLIDFEKAVKTRKQPGGNAEASQRCSTLYHLANIAIRLGRKLQWDPATEQFINDAEANRFVNIPMRAPWHL